MKKNLHIKVTDKLSELLNSREAATMLLDFVCKQKSNRVELDFSGVEFMSRSFADQFHKELNKLQNENLVTIELTNANEGIIRMLNSVARTQSASKRDFVKLPIFKYSNEDLLSDYLLSV